MFTPRGPNVGSVPHTRVFADSFLADLWEGPSNAICQLIIIMFANMFLASRLVVLLFLLVFLGIHLSLSIYSLTKSHFQTGLVVLLSLIAFVVGMINVVDPGSHCGRCFHIPPEPLAALTGT